MSLAGAMGGHTVVAKLLEIFGTGEQKRAYLPAMATGELRATMALTEPGGGSDPCTMTTVARRDGDEWVIDGAKTWISNARRSGLIALLVQDRSAGHPRHTGISVLLVENPTAGLTVSRDLPKLGYKGVESCELAFDEHCRVPASAVLGGAPGKGFAQMMKARWRDRPHSGRSGRSAWRARRWRMLWPTPRTGRALVSRSGSTGRSGNYLADMAASLTASASPGTPPNAMTAARRCDMEAGMAKIRCSPPGGDGDRAQRGAHPRRLRLFGSRNTTWNGRLSSWASATPPD